MSTTTIRVHCSRDYDVLIGSGLLQETGKLVEEVHNPCKVAIVSDSNVAPLYLDKVAASLSAAGFTPVSFVFPAGEASKNLSVYADILNFCAEQRLTRTDLIVALGGGVTGDMAGFAAASYLRGIEYVQMPTSLLAAVDSSVGGKTAVDIPAGKNLVGAFMQPLRVICDIDAFETLTEEVFHDGCAECIKYGVLESPRLLEIFAEGTAKENIEEVVAISVQTKANYVENDEFDTGLRRYLNLGHTIGHAIERTANFTLMHGHCVAIGMVMIARAGEGLYLTEPGTTEKLIRILETNELPISCDFTTEELLDGALADKKRKGDLISLIVPKHLGECLTHTVPVTELGTIIDLGKETSV
ncbi:MAG: 3-dehydroquinate synthase [Clostridia bacterium]|nr:3-dehydroquinate synthase [Clostridia bacterium]MBR1704769.1 3-dehydroquinate synthase [Clostridia bacterium]